MRLPKTLVPLLAALAALASSAPWCRAGVFPGSPFSDGAAGTTGAAFLKLPSGARAEALGGTGAAGVWGADALFWNPAGLAPPGRPVASELAVGYDALLSGSYASSLAFSRPMGKNAAVSAGFAFFSAGGIQGYSAVGDPTNRFAPYDLALSAAYAKRLSKASVGAGLKVIRSDVAGATGGTAALDLGVQSPNAFQLGDAPVDLGLSVRNLGPPLRVGGAASPLPFKAQLGGMWKMTRRFQTLLDGHVPIDEKPYLSVGVEGLMTGTQALAMHLRAGYNMRRARDAQGLAGFSAGFGVDLRRVRVDYAWVPFGDLGHANRVSIAVAF